MTNPGDRQAIPTSCIPKLSRADMGTAEARLFADASVFLERSNLRGRGFMFESVGDPGSFFTMTLTRPVSFRAGPAGDDLVPEEAPATWGLLLSPCL